MECRKTVKEEENMIKNKLEGLGRIEIGEMNEERLQCRKTVKEEENMRNE